MTTSHYDKEERRKLKERAEEARKNTTSKEGLSLFQAKKARKNTMPRKFRLSMFQKAQLEDFFINAVGLTTALGVGYGVLYMAAYLLTAKSEIHEYLGAVPDKAKKELALAYDELLMHNLDSTLAVVPGRELAIEEAHMITWAQAVNAPRKYIDKGHLSLRECIYDLSVEEAIMFREAQNQYRSSRKFVGRHAIGKATIDVYSHRPLYPEELRAEIANKRKELKMANDQTSEQMVNLARTRTR